MSKSYMHAFAMAAMLLTASVDVPAQSTRAAAPLEEPGQIVAFLFQVFRGDQAMEQAWITQTKDEPELREATRGVLATFDAVELGNRYGEPFSKLGTAQEFSACMDFIRSTDGAAVMSASRAAASPEDLLPALEALPTARKEATERFFKLPCFQKAVAFLGSAESQAIGKKYGQDMMCRHLRATRMDLLEKLEGMGHCTGT